MKQTVAFVVITCLCLLKLTAQEEMVQSTRDAINFGTFTPSANRAAIYGVEGPQGRIVGDIYLDTVWRQSVVYFYPEVVRRYDPKAADSVAGYRVRIDLYNSNVEFQVEGGVKAVEGTAIKRILFKEAQTPFTIINTTQLPRLPDVKGFFRLIGEGKLTVVQHPKIQVINPTYNVALNVGTKDTRLYKKTDYYYLKGSQLVKFKPNKKSLLQLMKNQKSRVEQYLAANPVNFKNPEDLTRLVGYYNALF